MSDVDYATRMKTQGMVRGDLLEVAHAINKVGRTSGRNDKLALLKHYKDLPGFKETLRFIFDPYIRTGIADAKLKKYAHLQEQFKKSDYVPSLFEVIEHYTKHQTGSDTDVIFGANFIFGQETPAEYDLAWAIVTKTLTIGVSVKTLNQVYGDDFIPKMGCMLGEKYHEFKGKVKGPFIVTEKLDGVRRLLVREGNTCRFYSRNGHEDEGLIEIEKEAMHLPTGMVYDGELLALGRHKNSIALRQATNSIANRKGVRTGLSFNIFDAVPLDEFKTGKSKYNALNRKIFLGAIFKDESIQHLTKDWARMCVAFGIEHNWQFIRPVPIIGLAYTDADIEYYVTPIWQIAGEGIMLNTTTGYYEIKRSKELLKVKHTESLDLPIVDFQEGEGKYKGMLGAFVVNYKGNRVAVGSGLTDSDRGRFWEDRHKLVGCKIEIDTFGESQDQAGNVSLNCPIFKGLRYDK